jgi:hypothetical protein
VTIVSPALHARIALVWRADAPTGPAARAFLAQARAALTQR